MRNGLVERFEKNNAQAQRLFFFSFLFGLLEFVCFSFTFSSFFFESFIFLFTLHRRLEYSSPSFVFGFLYIIFICVDFYDGPAGSRWVF